MGEMQKIQILPTSDNELPMAHCLMFYEYQNKLDDAWIDTVESLFASLGQIPTRTTGCVGRKQINGSYSRTVKRLRGLLREDGQNANIRINSEETMPDCGFLPCNIQIVWNTSTGGIRQGLVARRQTAEFSLNRFVETIAFPVFKEIGICYAHAFDFPAAYGPELYLSSVGSILQNRSVNSNTDYKNRITSWRDKTWHQNKRPSEGFLREVYPINFLLEKQCNSVNKKCQLGEFLSSVEMPQQDENVCGMYRWDVPESMLAEVRQKFENTGIVLSSWM